MVEEQEFIEVIGAKEHNLKKISMKIPRNKLVVITGISGSGKSSLAFGTIYAEGQRRYMETFSHYARQFIGNIECIFSSHWQKNGQVFRRSNDQLDIATL